MAKLLESESTDSQSACGWHAVAQGADEVAVHAGHRLFLGQTVQLRLEQLFLQIGIIQLRVGIGDLHAFDEQLKSLGQLRIVSFSFGPT